MKTLNDFETIELLKTHLNSSPNLRIEVYAEEIWIGWCQLKADEDNQEVEFYDIYSEISDEIISVSKNNDGTQNVEINEEFKEGFDFKKEVHQIDYYTWGKGVVEKDFFLKKINDFIDENPEGDTYDFIEYLDDLIIQDVGSSPDTILEYFESKECDFGVGTKRYQNDISWFVADVVAYIVAVLLGKKVEHILPVAASCEEAVQLADTLY